MSDSILSLESAKIRNYIIPIFLDKKAREFRSEYFLALTLIEKNITSLLVYTIHLHFSILDSINISA